MSLESNYKESSHRGEHELSKKQPKPDLQQRYMCGIYSVDYYCQQSGLGKDSPLNKIPFNNQFTNKVSTPFFGFSPWSEFGIGARLKEAGFDYIYKYFNTGGSLTEVEDLVNQGKKVILLLFRNDSPEWLSNTPETYGPHWVVVENTYGSEADFFYQIYDPNQGRVLISKKTFQDCTSPNIKNISPMELTRRFNGYFVIS